jgi:hypothetical protein
MNKPKVTNLVLIVGGMIFILASLGAFMVLYEFHSFHKFFDVAHEGPGLDNFGMFMVGVGAPTAIGVVVGATCLTLGIRQHLNEPY